MLGPLSSRAERWRIPPWLFALLTVGCIIGLFNWAIILLSGPVAEWIGKAPEIAATVRERLHVLDRPIAALHDLQTAISGNKPTSGLNIDITGFMESIVEFLTPAFGQLILFFATLFFFLLVRPQLLRTLILLPSEREARLRTLRIIHAIEQDLTQYLGTVTLINIAVGAATGIIVHVLGYPNAALWGALAFLFNYLPYVGPAIMLVVLFIVGLVTFPFLLEAAIVPICFMALTTVEGNLITPNIIGKRLELNPFAVLLALAFWTWLWGPVGTFLAVPLLITGSLAIEHFLVEEKGKLPG